MTARPSPLSFLAAGAALGLPGLARAEEGACVPRPPSALALDLALLLPAFIPPEPDKVDPNGYDHDNGDNDGDGVRNKDDALPNDPRDSKDSDKDGVGDKSDAFPDDPKEWLDSDCDGVGDNADPTYDGPGRYARVSRWSGDGVYGQQARFTVITSPDGVMHVQLKLKLTGQRSDEREAHWEKEIENFWSNDKFKLDVQWVESGQDNTISVVRGSGRANSGMLFTTTDKWVAAHEIGHLLGLNDEYSDRTDPYRMLGEPNSIMRANWDGAVPYTRHLRTIMSHFDCETGRAATEQEVAAVQGRRVETPTPTPDTRPRVQAPAGTTRYLASADAWKDCFVKKDGENAYLAFTRGAWWRWEKTIDDERLQFVHPTTGERITVSPAELSVVVD